MDELGIVFPEVLAAAQARQEWAWDRLVRSIGPKVLGYARSQGAVEPEEILGEVLLEVVKGLPAFSGTETGFRSWVFVIAHHRVIDARRRASRRPTVAWPDGLDPVAPEGAVRPTGDLGDLQAMVDELPSGQRDVLLLRSVVGLSVDETATVLGKTPESVRVAHHRALTRLRQKTAAGV